MLHETREAWLVAAVTQLRPVLGDAQLVPGNIRVSCGWPARGALSPSKRRIGECWPAEQNEDGYSHVFVSPLLAEPISVVGTLLHELIHASLPAKCKHNKRFAKAALSCGLEGKPTATSVGGKLAERINARILPTLGDYPHQSIDAKPKPKQGTRLRLYECECIPDKEQGITNKVRVASDNWQATCGRCEVILRRVDVKGEGG